MGQLLRYVLSPYTQWLLNGLCYSSLCSSSTLSCEDTNVRSLTSTQLRSLLHLSVPLPAETSLASSLSHCPQPPTLRGTMATNIPEISVFLNPALCANTKPQENGVTTPCQKNATQGCDGCHLVQVCGPSYWTQCNSRSVC